MRGAIYWSGSAGGGSSTQQTALAPGEDEEVRIIGEGIQVNFNNARGYIRYTDSTGLEWQTHFAYAGDMGHVVPGSLRVDIMATATTEELGEPRYNAEQWVNAPRDLKPPGFSDQ